MIDRDASSAPPPRLRHGRGLVFTVARGTEAVLAGELRRLGFEDVKPGHGRVLVADEGLAAAMRGCLYVRTALRVLMPLASFPAADADAVYEGAREIRWEDWLTTTSTFAVAGTTSAAPPMAYAPVLGLRVKDAIADRLRDRLGSRPDVDRDDPDVRVYLHVESAARSRGGIPGVTVGLDVSGDRMHARGYRTARGAAPLRETLAAAILLGAGWHGQVPLLDPMCGSGTIPIEAALIACGVAPGRVGGRTGFCFERWPVFGDEERRRWHDACAEADAAVVARPPVPIAGSDVDEEVLGAAVANARMAHSIVARAITWKQVDAREISPPWRTGAVVSNPPYGERLGGPGLEAFYRSLGRRLARFHGWSIHLVMPPECRPWLGLEPAWVHPLRNGPLEVGLHRFEPTGGARATPARLPGGSPPRSRSSSRVPPRPA